MAPTKGADPASCDDRSEARIVCPARQQAQQSSKPTTQKVNWRDLLPVHPAADLFPIMSEAELRALGEDIKNNGLQESIALWSPWTSRNVAAYATDSTGYENAPEWFLLDGRNRLDAIELIGRPMDFLHDLRRDGTQAIGTSIGVKHFYSNTDPYAYVISANLHRRHLSQEQRRELIAKLLKAAPEKSDRQVAAVVQADHKTVGAVRADLEGRGEIPHVETRTDTKGREQPARKAPSGHDLAVVHSSKSVEWYTPPEIVAMVSDVLGGIDLDPCWHPESPVRATTTYVEEQDGLSQDWNGRVYLNPPYGRPIDGWIEKLVGEHEAGRVTEAIALVPARVDTEWFRRFDAFPRCFPYGRLTFANADNPAPFPCAVVYLGKNVRKFAEVFDDERVGGVWVRLDRPAPAPQQVADDLGGIPPFLRRIAS
jgi:hypothetical protein